MIDMSTIDMATLAVSVVPAVTAITLALIALRGFNRWIDLKRRELSHGETASPPVAGRIEVADLKERVRRLEAIAAGVEL